MMLAPTASASSASRPARTAGWFTTCRDEHGGELLALMTDIAMHPHAAAGNGTE
jgi:hypothetical protein